jgi:uncharacterized protein
VGWSRRQLVVLFGTIVVLAAWNVELRGLVPGNIRVWANAALGLALLVPAYWSRLSSNQLGLDRRTLRSGLLWGGATLLILLAVITGASQFSNADHLFSTPRTSISLASLWFQALVAIPVGTVIVEEIAFRGVLLGLFLVRWSGLIAVFASSFLFGLWHIEGVVSSTNGGAGHVALAVVGTFFATFLAGLGFCWLRLRSGSLLASALAHIGTNSIALVTAWYLAH